MGIGHTESVRDEAFLALLKIKPGAHQVVPVLVRSLEQASDVPYEMIAAVRAFDGHVTAAKGPLERLLSNKKARAGAASALAFVDPERAGLRAILEEELFHDEQLDAVAAIGLGRLAERGERFDNRTRKRVDDLVQETGNLFGICSLLRRDPTDERTAKLLVEALRYAHSVFDAIGIREAELTLCELAKHRSVRGALLAELEFVTEDAEMSEFDRLQEQEYARLRAAKILVAAQVELKQAVHCLDRLATRENVSVQGEAADILADCQTERQAAIDVLVRLLGNNGYYIVGGDFYGNGGDGRVVGDRAAQALAALGASEALFGLLENEDVDVRIRAIRALSSLGEEAVTDRLLQGARDLDYRVRRETMSALGCLGRAHVASREKLKGTLEAAVHNDRRRSVRDQAKRALRSWR
jgi:HEAT repeat protein